MEYRSYPLVHQSQKHYDDVARHVAKMAKRLKVQLKSEMFDGSSTMTILTFIPAFQMMCDTNGIHEVEAMSLFHFCMKKPSGAAFIARTCPTSLHQSCQGEKLTSSCQVVNYLLNNIATYDIVVEANEEITNIKQLQDFNTADYSHSLWREDLYHCPA